jgi:hypothetical protein
MVARDALRELVDLGDDAPQAIQGDVELLRALAPRAVPPQLADV